MNTSHPFDQGPIKQSRNPEPLSVQYFLKFSVKVVVVFVLMGVIAGLFTSSSPFSNVLWSLEAAFYILMFAWTIGGLFYLTRRIRHDLKKYSDA